MKSLKLFKSKFSLAEP